jgi:signal transduction histidine kinase
LYILADAEKLKIAFLNIIINAIEAMPGETGHLSITISNDAPLHKVIIEDNGSGINEENLSRLFEPYFTSKRNGLGLGLASTLNIIQAHKAVVDVKSQVGEGTTFILSFNPAE